MAGVTAEAGANNIPSSSTASPADNKPDQPGQITDSAQNTNNKPRKPRRERLPLPDPIPDTPVKRYPEPNRTELQKKIDVVDAQLQKCFDRLNSTRAFHDERQKIREAGKPTFEAARKAIAELNEQCSALFEERKDINAKLKEIRDAGASARNATSSFEVPGAGRDGNEALKNVRTIEELEQRIEDYEMLLQRESMSMAKEKRLVNQISFLKFKARDFILERAEILKNEKNAKESRLALRKELEETKKQQDVAIDTAKAKLEEQKKILTDLRAEEDAQIKKLQETIPQVDRAAERKKIVELKAEIKKMREDFDVERDNWFLNERIHIEQQKIAKRKKYEQIQAEREARRKAWEAEQAQYPEPHPYQEEKDMCSGLTVYLQTLLGETVEKSNVNLTPSKADNAPSLKTTPTSREITTGGKAIGKNATGSDFGDLAFNDYMKKRGKSKNKRVRGRPSSATVDVSAAENVQLKPHSIDYLTAFSRLEIKPPNKISEVRAALDAVKEKAAYYDTAPAPSEEQKAKKGEQKQKRQSLDKKLANGSVDMSTDVGANAFPGLQSDAAAPSRSRDSSMPSFKAVASGAATAPPPTIIASALDMPPVQQMEEQLSIEEAINKSEMVSGTGAEQTIPTQALESPIAES